MVHPGARRRRGLVCYCFLEFELNLERGCVNEFRWCRLGPGSMADGRKCYNHPAPPSSDDLGMSFGISRIIMDDEDYAFISFRSFFLFVSDDGWTGGLVDGRRRRREEVHFARHA
ncbi:hypothetical protein VTJ04DRAFT_8283 [Mycothermus thermophilus]|uniref:uncharacterized protein n=1 Tax=Humicola insolens TaxID=85995 RepID=UPI0037421C7E